MWAKFDTIEEFNQWHEGIKTFLGIPRPDGVTTEYTIPITTSDGTIRAWVEHSWGSLVEGDAPIVDKPWN